MSVSVEDAVDQVWRELKLEGWNTKDAVKYIYEQFGDYDDLESVLFKSVGIKNWPEVSDAIPRITYGPDDKLYGCQTDEYGYAIDPYSYQRIPESRLVSYTSGGKRWCFDINSLHEQLGRADKMINPYNGEPLPVGVVNRARDLGRGSLVTIAGTGVSILQECYHNYGDIIIMTMSVADGNLLENVMDYDVLSNETANGDVVTGDVSLYSFNLRYVPDAPLHSISLQPYGDNIEYRNKCLLELFRYCKGSTETNTKYNTIYHFIGALLKLLPVFTDLDIDIDPKDTVGDTIVKALKSYGGYHLWNVMDLVYEGTSLYENDMDDLLVDVAPNVEINTVQVVSDDYSLLIDIKANLRQIARETDNKELSDAIGQPTIEWLKKNVKIVDSADIRFGVELTDDKKKYIDELVLWISTLGDESERILTLVSYVMFIRRDYEDLIYDALSRINVQTTNPGFAWGEYSNLMSHGSYPGTSEEDNVKFTEFVKSIKNGTYPPKPSRKVIAHLDNVNVFKHYIEVEYIVVPTTSTSGTSSVPSPTSGTSSVPSPTSGTSSVPSPTSGTSSVPSLSSLSQTPVPSSRVWSTPSILTVRDVFLWSIDVVKSKIVKYVVENDLIDLVDVFELVFADSDTATMHSLIVALFEGPGIPQSFRDYLIENKKGLRWMIESLRGLRCGKESCMLAIIRHLTTVDNITTLLPFLRIYESDYDEVYSIYATREWTDKDKRYEFLWEVLSYVDIKKIIESFDVISEEVKNEVITILIIGGYQGLSYMQIPPTKGLVRMILEKTEPTHYTQAYLNSNEAQKVMIDLLREDVNVPVAYFNNGSIRTLITEGLVPLSEITIYSINHSRNPSNMRNDKEVQEVILKCIRSSGTNLTCPTRYLSDENLRLVLTDPRTHISVVENLLLDREWDAETLPLSTGVVRAIAHDPSLWSSANVIRRRLIDQGLKYDDGSVVDQRLMTDLDKASGTGMMVPLKWNWDVGNLDTVLGSRRATGH